MKEIAAATLAVLILAASGPALGQPSGDCAKKCDAEKASRDANCPAFNEYTEATRRACLEGSQKTHGTCASRCKAPASKPAAAPARK
jgi:hypothetical protein